MSEDEEQVVTLRSSETARGDERLEAAVPSPRGLFEAIERFVKLAHIVRTRRVNKPRRLLAIDSFIEIAM